MGRRWINSLVLTFGMACFLGDGDGVGQGDKEDEEAASLEGSCCTGVSSSESIWGLLSCSTSGSEGMGMMVRLIPLTWLKPKSFMNDVGGQGFLVGRG
jgi:hypothetical protein